jgi:hypothetical protein
MYFKKQGSKMSSELPSEQGCSAKPVVIGIGLIMGAGLMSFGMMKCMGMMKGMMANMCTCMKTPSLEAPELHNLFDEWLKKLDQETLALLNHQREVDVSTLAATLKISERSAIQLVTLLASKGKIDLRISASGKCDHC